MFSDLRKLLHDAAMSLQSEKSADFSCLQSHDRMSSASALQSQGMSSASPLQSQGMSQGMSSASPLQSQGMSSVSSTGRSTTKTTTLVTSLSEKRQVSKEVEEPAADDRILGAHKTHILYEHGVCQWPNCDTPCQDFAHFQMYGLTSLNICLFSSLLLSMSQLG